MHRRVLLLVFALGLGALAWYAARRDPPPDEGLVVHVQVLDGAGGPLHPVQLERIYDETRVDLDKRGAARLTRVLLRAGDEPSPEAFGIALRPIARYHALRPGRPPCAVRARSDGSYNVTYHLQPCGLLRLHVRPTHLGACGAVIESTLPPGSWARVGAHDVTRAGSVIDYRIFAGTEEVLLRIDGEPDASGAVTVATRRYIVQAPSPGHVVQTTIEPEPVAPIVGRVVAGDGPAPPSWEGTLRLREVLEDGRAVPWGEVPIEPDGSFVVRTSSEATYRLDARLWCFPDPLKDSCEGGSTITLRPPGPPQWILLAHPGLDGAGRPIALRLRSMARPGEEVAIARVVRHEEDRMWVAVTPRGRWRLEATVAGTPSTPPLRAAPVEIDTTVSGEIRAELAFEVEPHGMLVVKTTAASWEGVRSARVYIDGQVTTLVRGAGQEREMLYIRAGTQALRIEWDDEAGTITSAAVDIVAGGRAELTVDRSAAH